MATAEAQYHPPPDVLAVQEAAWRHREARVRRIVEAWARYHPQGEVTIGEDATTLSHHNNNNNGEHKDGTDTTMATTQKKRIRRERWPAAWATSRRTAPEQRALPGDSQKKTTDVAVSSSRENDDAPAQNEKSLSAAQDDHQQDAVSGGFLPANTTTPVVESIPNGRAACLGEFCVERARRLASSKNDVDAFFVVDLGAVDKLYQGFVDAMPSVRPYYAVKCFPNEEIIKTLAKLGAGFDCASEFEARLAHKYTNRVIFANPCKRTSDVRYLVRSRIPFTTFDSINEVKKIHDVAKFERCSPPELILRLRADDPKSKLPFGAKYGASSPKEAARLVAAASEYGLTVAGVSFHVGSGARSPDAYRNAIQIASQVPVHCWKVLDIGGGFCGDFRRDGTARVSAAGDETLSAVVEKAIEDFFPKYNVRDDDQNAFQIIAEPGRYFAESSAALCAKIVGLKDKGLNERHVWIADGIYGAFNAILYDKIEPHAVVLSPTKTPTPDYDLDTTNKTTITVWGPTCDSLDCVFSNVEDAPPVDLDDWLLFLNFGAYTLAGSSDFNGIPATRLPVFYVRSRDMVWTDIDAKVPLLYSPRPPMEVVKHF